MNLNLQSYLSEWRKFMKEERMAAAIPPKKYGEYLSKKRNKKGKRRR